MEELKRALERLSKTIEEIRKLPSHRLELDVLREFTNKAHGNIASAFHGNIDSPYYAVFEEATNSLSGVDLRSEQDPKAYRLLLLSLLDNYSVLIKSTIKQMERGA